MKRLIILSTILMTFLSCSVKEKPEFLRVENIHVTDSNSKRITITADALFLNPNIIGGQLETEAIKIYVNDNEMGQVSAERFDVPAEKEFTIPIHAEIPTDSLFSDKSLSGLLGSLFSRKIKVQYKGDITYKIFGFSYSYNLDKTDEIKIK
ncbi:LEA type 2 family protein [Aestuariibaculum sediminum]|uniref:LEA type 2 family protein n=1 Tax=Aestuariibaculum sediminum TaxID=2770637 RepID=A0A8J6UD49_9FLAO|nr:LEA type 2 family protein [Aestuariibaculum sediminum]MBD0832619.1 LEA type 2 family protein [Aestuariibaculum sediminum]